MFASNLEVNEWGMRSIDDHFIHSVDCPHGKKWKNAGRTSKRKNENIIRNCSLAQHSSWWIDVPRMEADNEGEEKNIMTFSNVVLLTLNVIMTVGSSSTTAQVSIQ